MENVMIKNTLGFLKLFSFSALLLFSQIALAADKAQASRLLSASGVTAGIESFPVMFKTGIDQVKSEVPDEVYNVLISTIDTSMKPAQVLNRINSEIEQNFSDEEIQELLTWYDSKPGIKFAKAENLTSTPEGYQAMLSEAPTLLENEKLIKFARKIEKLTKGTDSSMNLQLNAQVAMISAFASLNPDLPKQSVSDRKAQIRAQMEMIRPSIEKQVLASYAFSYKGFTDSEMQSYLQFMQSKTAIKFITITIASIDSAFELTIEEYAKQFAETMAQLKAN